jgi:hypothetical protein
MASMNERVQELINSVQTFNSQASLLLAAVGQGQLDPEKIQEQIQTATQSAIDAVLAQLDGYDATTILQRQDMLKLAQDIRNVTDDEKFFFEFFRRPFSFADQIEVGSVVTVAGDESVDCADTSLLEVGQEYVICSGDLRETVTVEAVLTSTRFRATSEVSASYSGATLKRTSAQLDGQSTRFAPGDIYYGGKFALGLADVDKAILIRRGAVGELSVYFQDATHESWTLAPWEWVRTNEDGTQDVEYRLPARGDFDIKIVNESDVEVVTQYIVGVHQDTGLLGDHHPPVKPTNVSPAAGAIDLQETPTLTGSVYSHPLGTSQGALQVRVYSDADSYAEAIYDSGEQPAGSSFKLPAGILSVGGTFKWEIRYKDSQGAWSPWSDMTAFDTAASFVYIETPTITNPANGATDIPEQPTLTSSPFAVSGGSDNHVGSRWMIREAGGTYDDPVYDSGASLDLESHVVPAGNLLDGEVTYYAKVQHEGEVLGASEWSPEVGLTTKDVFAVIIGIAKVASGGGAGTWQNIDGDGNDVTVDTTYFNNHPVYGGIQTVSIDDQDMVLYPKFYYKVGVGPAGSDQAGKKCWWISDQPVEGYKLHPAALDHTAVLDQFYLGAYEATDDGGIKAGSETGVAPLASIDFPTMKSRIEARNTDGVEGFHMPDIYEISAVDMLMLIEMGTPDAQSAIGTGNSDSSAAVNTGASNAVWRGLHEFWGNVLCMVDGLKTNTSNQLQVFDDQGNQTWVDTGITISTSGWITAMLEMSGTDYDFDALFVPANTDSTEGNGTFADYLYSAAAGNEYVCRHGGYYGNASKCGPFSLHLNLQASHSYAFNGSRLAKR